MEFSTWVFPKIGVPQNGWFIMENPIMDDLFFPIFLETPTLERMDFMQLLPQRAAQTSRVFDP